MALKIDTNQSAVAFHVVTGATVFPYAVDAQHAISNFPLEWSESPWTADAAAAARKELTTKYEQDVADAKARGLTPPPPPPPEPPPLTPEDQAAIDEHNKAVAEASERLNAYYEKKAAEKVEADQVAADHALVASLPPVPDVTIRRPFGRKGEPTEAEKAMAQKAAEKKAADDKLVADKAAEDKLAGNTKTSP